MSFNGAFGDLDFHLRSSCLVGIFEVWLQAPASEARKSPIHPIDEQYSAEIPEPRGIKPVFTVHRDTACLIDHCNAKV